MPTLTRRATRPLTRHLHRAQRRHASDHASAQSASHGSHADPAPTSEGFGASFYLAIALVPASMLVYSFSRPAANGQKNFVTRMIERWEEDKEALRRKNAVHTGLVEQAGHDRNLFLNTPQPNWHDLRMPEMIGRGSPIAVPAGHSVDLGHVMEHYRKRNEREEEEKLRRLSERRERGEV